MGASTHSSKGVIVGLIAIAAIFVVLAFSIANAYRRESPVDRVSARAPSSADIETYLAVTRIRDTTASIDRTQADVATDKERASFARDLSLVNPEVRASFQAFCSKPPLVSQRNGFCSVAHEQQ